MHTRSTRSRCVFPEQGSLGAEIRGDGCGSSGECDLDSIANDFKEGAAVAVDHRTQQRQLTIHRHTQGIAVPQRCAALDVGKENGDSARLELGHEIGLGDVPV